MRALPHEGSTGSVYLPFTLGLLQSQEAYRCKHLLCKHLGQEGVKSLLVVECVEATWAPAVSCSLCGLCRYLAVRLHRTLFPAAPCQTMGVVGIADLACWLLK